MDQAINKSNLLDIKQIIQFGTRLPELYSIKFYKAVYERDVSVKIRGLSNYEYDIINVEMYSEIQDPETIKYVLDIDNEEELEDSVNEENNESKEDVNIIDKELPDNINRVEILKAFMFRNILITYHGMKDYYPNLTINDIKQMDGINEIAKRINEKSGRTKEVQEKIKFFRKQSL